MSGGNTCGETPLAFQSYLQPSPQPAPVDAVSVPLTGTRLNRRNRKDAGFSGSEGVSHACSPVIRHVMVYQQHSRASGYESHDFHRLHESAPTLGRGQECPSAELRRRCAHVSIFVIGGIMCPRFALLSRKRSLRNIPRRPRDADEI